MKAIRTQIEDAVIASLQPLSRAADGYLRAIKPYRGELEGAANMDELRDSLRGMAPAALVSTGPGRYREMHTARRRAVMDMDVEILIVSASLRSNEDRMRGAGALTVPPRGDPGIYLLLEQVTRILIAQPLAADGAGYMIPVDEVLLTHVPDLTVWRMRFRIAADVKRNTPDEGDLLDIKANHNLASGEDPAANPVVVGITELTP